MSVYVDDACIEAKLGRWPAKWSHLTADSDEELHAFAVDVLGLRREWFQPNKLGRIEANHYDVTVTKRKEAIRLGAISEPMREGARRRRAAIYARVSKERAS